VKGGAGGGDHHKPPGANVTPMGDEEHARKRPTHREMGCQKAGTTAGIGLGGMGTRQLRKKDQDFYERKDINQTTEGR